MIDAYEAINEHPRVFCSYGNTPASALMKMALLLKKNNIKSFSSANVGYLLGEDVHYVTIYV